MSLIRCFTLYDSSKEQFYLISGDKTFLNTQLSSMKLELQPKFSEIKTQVPQLFKFKSTLGCYLCQQDTTQRFYFILLSHPDLEEKFQTKTLDRISQLIKEVPNYNQLPSDELQKQKQKAIENLIQDCENQLQRDTKIKQDSVIDNSQGGLLISNSGNMFTSNQNILQSQATFRHGFNTEKDFSIETLTKVFRCFMMYDYNRQFFFMFIRRGFPIDKTWSNERNKLEKEIMKKYLDPDDPKAKPQEPPLSFKYKGDFGVYQAKYDKAAKCYFILLSRFGVKEDFQKCLVGKIYDEIQKIKNYITLKYDSLEHKVKRNIEQLINNYEEEIIKYMDQNLVDQKLFEKKYQKLQQNAIQIQIYQEEKRSPLIEQQNQMKDALNIQQEYILDEEDIVPWMTELNEKNDKQELYQSKNNLYNNNMKKMKSL
ncbi:unnamed protein product [Paramecium primaurelia]|uniref:Uncharacterized protein n=1 Tax=Paramecium primaurelia TaxID=5886 RepID=A0A8S1JRK1_PARPR|nr:unnamed protein product [Paramecium primaurelia]